MSNPTQPPQNVAFRNPLNLLAYFILDRAASDLTVAANQLQSIGQTELVKMLRSNADLMTAARADVLALDQSAITLHTAGDMPKPRLV